MSDKKTTAWRSPSQSSRQSRSPICASVPPRYLEGAFSEIHVGRHHVTKKLHLEDVGSPDLLAKSPREQDNASQLYADWKHELDALHACRSVANVPRLLSASSNFPRARFTIKMTRCPGHPLDYLYDYHPHLFTPLLACTIVRQTATILRDMHALSITHYDVKIENLLYDTVRCTTSLIDFGFCSRNLLRSYHGSLSYSAPELLDDAIPYPKGGPACDIYALGVTLYFLLCMIHHCYNHRSELLQPFPWRSSKAKLSKPALQEQRVLFLSSLAEQMLLPAPQRPNAATVLARFHDFDKLCFP